MFKIIVATIIVYTIIFDITAVSFRFFPEKQLFKHILINQSNFFKAANSSNYLSNPLRLTSK